MGNPSSFVLTMATGYAAFCCRDPYYSEMAAFVCKAAKEQLGRRPKIMVDLGAGIGMSTIQALEILEPDTLLAVEPNEESRHYCGLATMGDPRVAIKEGLGEKLAEVVSPSSVDVVVCCQTFHILSKPENGLLPQTLEQITEVLKPSGVFAFDLGPSNYKFALPLSDHRSGKVRDGETLTELSHPLYQKAHELAIREVQNRLPDVETLWPPPDPHQSFESLKSACEDAGLGHLVVQEYLSPVSGRRVIEFIRNGWSVFFRRGQPANLTAQEKLEIMNSFMAALFHHPDFQAMRQVMSYHPTAVLTAVKL